MMRHYYALSYIRNASYFFFLSSPFTLPNAPLAASILIYYISSFFRFEKVYLLFLFCCAK